MVKKGLVMLWLILIAGWSFAQTDSETTAETDSETAPITDYETAPRNTMPMNTVTLDIGPIIAGAAIGAVGSIIDEEGVSSSGFGIAAQYERQILEKLTVGGRFAYLGGGLGIPITRDALKAVLEINLSSFSLEGHARFYPWARAFFLDGMLGYANLSAKFSGEAIVQESDIELKKPVSFDASRSYFKLGAKIGWRIDFGKPGGFVFEPSFGYYAGVGLGDTLGKQLSDDLGGDDIGDVEPMFQLIEQVVFAGGPRLALSFGWRF